MANPILVNAGPAIRRRGIWIQAATTTDPAFVIASGANAGPQASGHQRSPSPVPAVGVTNSGTSDEYAHHWHQHRQSGTVGRWPRPSSPGLFEGWQHQQAAWSRIAGNLPYSMQFSSTTHTAAPPRFANTKQRQPDRDRVGHQCLGTGGHHGQQHRQLGALMAAGGSSGTLNTAPRP